MINPRALCKFHLSEEHSDIHKILEKLTFDHNFQNNEFLDKIEIKSIVKRHDALALEMMRRDIVHDTPIDKYDVVTYHINDTILSYEIDKKVALKELITYCDDCRKNVINLKGKVKILDPFWSIFNDKSEEFIKNINSYNNLILSGKYENYLPDTIKDSWNFLPLLTKYCILESCFNGKRKD